MDFITNVTAWFEQNWGVALFGGLTLGGLVTTAVLLFKQWVANKVQGTKYENLFNSMKSGISNVMDLYKKEQEKTNVEKAKNAFLQESQSVMMDAFIRMALASKLDAEDKAAIVGNLQKLKTSKPKEIVEELVENTQETAEEFRENLETDPLETINNVTEEAESLLDKYRQKE